MYYLVLSLFLAPSLAAILAKIGVAQVSKGRDELSFLKAYAISAGAALLASISHLGGLTLEQGISLVWLMSFIAVAAYMDRETAWAHDLVMLPALVAAVQVGVAFGHLPISHLTGFIAAPIAYVAIHVLWLVAAAVFQPVLNIPPADILSLIIPMLCLGINFSLAAYMAAVSVILGLGYFVPSMRKFMCKRDLEDAVKNEIGMVGNDVPVVTYLTIGFPVLAIALLLVTL